MCNNFHISFIQSSKSAWFHATYIDVEPLGKSCPKDEVQIMLILVITSIIAIAGLKTFHRSDESFFCLWLVSSRNRKIDCIEYIYIIVVPVLISLENHPRAKEPTGFFGQVVSCRSCWSVNWSWNDFLDLWTHLSQLNPSSRQMVRCGWKEGNPEISCLWEHRISERILQRLVEESFRIIN